MKIYKITYVENEELKEIACTEYSLEKYKKTLKEQGKEVLKVVEIKKKVAKA